MFTRKIAYSLLVVTILFLHLGSVALADSAKVKVSAQLRSYLNISARTNTSKVILNPEDLDKEYIDLLSSGVIEISTNHNEVILDFSSGGEHLILASPSGEGNFTNRINVKLSDYEKENKHVKKLIDLRIFTKNIKSVGSYNFSTTITAQAI